MSIDAMKQALEALEAGDWYIGQLELLVYTADDTDTHDERTKVQAAIKALRAAIEQTEEEHQEWAKNLLSRAWEGEEMSDYRDREYQVMREAEIDLWRQRYEALLKTLADRQPIVPPMMLADSQSYELGLSHGAAAEREACAQVCDDWPNGRDDVCLLADAIRARGEK